jgi:CP family cyanate transporter-like MFS transporter
MSKRRPLLLITGLFIASCVLRPQIVGIGPLLSRIQSGLGVAHSVAGLLSTVIVLCMGLFAPVAYLIMRRVGPRWTIAGALSLIAAFGLARVVAKPAAAVIVLTFPVGIGIAVAGSVMPLIVKESWPRRPVLATAVYTIGISLGASVAAATAVPLADGLGGWRDALLVFSLFTAVAAVGWTALSGGAGFSGIGAAPWPRLPLGSRTSWLLVGIFALVEITYYGINAWLPAAFTERGWSQSSAGGLLTVINAVTVPVSLLLALRGDLRGSRRFWLATGTAMQLGGLLGVVLAPAGGWAWAVVIGAANGLLFPSMMLMPLDVAEDPAEVGAVAALMLGGGFTLSCFGPFLLGLLRDATGSFRLPMTLILIITGLILVIVLRTREEGLRRDPRSIMRTAGPESEHAMS